MIFITCSRWARGTVKLQWIQLAAIFSLLSSFFSLLSSLCPRRRQRSHQGAGWPRKGLARWKRVGEVATGCCKNAVNRTCGDFLSSLFSLLSFFCSLPSSLLGPDPFLYHPALLGTCKNAMNLACGDFLSSLFSLLLFLCSLPSSLLAPGPFLYNPALLGPVKMQ